MMLDEFQAVKREIAELERAAAVAEGRAAAALERLRGEFGVETLDEAEALLVRLKKKERAAQDADAAAKAAYLAMKDTLKEDIETFLGGE